MNPTAQAGNLLANKKGLFEAYEAASNALLTCEAASVEHYITQRGKLANQIDAVNIKLKMLYAAEGVPALLGETAEGTASYSDIPAEYLPLFEMGQEIRSLIHRIGELNPQITERMRQLRADAQAHMKKNENVPKIRKYLTNLNDSGTDYGSRGKKA